MSYTTHPSRKHTKDVPFHLLSYGLLEVKPEKSILELLAEMPTGDTDTWNDAELWSVYSYVRASKLLCLPEAFKAVLSSHAC